MQDNSVKPLLPAVLSTYPRYHDRKSRRAVEACLVAYLRRTPSSHEYFTAIVNFISRESKKRVIAATNAFVLLEWSCLVQNEIVRERQAYTDLFVNICLAAAQLLDKCGESEVRGGVQHSALVIARRGLRNVFQTDDFGEDALSKVVPALVSGPNAGSQNALYLGVVCGVSARIPDREEQLRAMKKDILEFYTKFIIASKTAIPLHQATGLHDFFIAFVESQDVASSIVPAIEKAILRSPEIVLENILAALATSLPSNIDVAENVTAKLAKPLASAMASTNPAIRDGANRALSLLVKKGGSPASVQKVAGELLASMKTAKAANFDLRAMLADCLRSTEPEHNVSTFIALGLSPLAAKEANETALKRQISALSRHYTFMLQTGAVEKQVNDTMLKGCAEKRLPFRKSWLLGTGSMLKDLTRCPSESRAREFVTSASNLLQSAYDEVAQNPLPSVQTGFAAVGYVIPTLTTAAAFASDLRPKQFQSVQKQVLEMGAKQSFLINSKVYTRLTTVEDMQWALYALISASSELDNVTVEAKTAWARAILHLLLAPEAKSEVRRETGVALSRAYLANPASIGHSIVLGIWDILQTSVAGIRANNRDNTINTELPLRSALRCITPPKASWSRQGHQVPDQVLETQTVSTVTLLRPELIHGVDWITSCLTLGVDPGSLSTRRSQDILSEILSHFEEESLRPLNVFETAACNAAATIAFVGAEATTSLIVEQFSKDLDPSQLEAIGPTEAAIAHAPEGEVFVDVLSTKTNDYVENKNRKDYDLEKWEEEVRAQLAQKKGSQPKKLTADQQAKVDAQLAKEILIRQNVRKASGHVRRGAGFIRSLASGPPTDANIWMSPAMTALTTALEAGASLITDDEIVSAYLACSGRVSDRLGTLRPFIGVATLRSLGTVHLPESYEVEALSELGTRVLYRLRFAAEQRPFDIVTFSYTLPLIFSVLDNGHIGDLSSDDADAQVLLALEYLSFQMNMCTDTHLPRVQMLKRLIWSIQRYPQHYRTVKDSLLELVASISLNITTEERDTLLDAVTLPQVAARSATLQAIHAELDLSDLEYSVHVWIACQDEDDDNAATALAIWEESDFTVQDKMVEEIPMFLSDKARATRISAAKALAQALAARTDQTQPMIKSLEVTYRKEARPLVPSRNRMGILQRGELVDEWEKRSGIALALKELAQVLPEDQILPLMDFLVSEGPLCDRHFAVRTEMVEAGTTIVALRGNDCLEPLMNLFETVLQGPDKATQESDWVNEAVIVLYGSLARHLPAGDSRTLTVLTKLMDTLSTPSESVQYAVAGCLPPLVRGAEVEVGPYITSLLDQLVQAKAYAARRGAAYGLAGVVKGKGVSALRQYRVMRILQSATENKKSADHRQGALFAYELFSLILGRTFEPYVVEVLPQLLGCFGDPNAAVREACLDTAKACFATLSSFGVHQVLPRLLEGLDETQWRSKKGACDLLGAMAYLDPQQLATSLPDIIPPLTAVLTDSHKEVRAAANNSLQRFGEVISNPEVKSMVPTLLKALSDPTKYTEDALDGLIKISFIHYLDAPSLALVVRILERGLGDRSLTKRKAAQIIGSLAHLTERRDIVTHLPILVSGLRIASVDPVPATRATASKALGSLVEKLGEDALPDLIPSLMTSLRTDTGAGDRLGSAQALSEVLAGLGTSRLEETLPTILQNVASSRATVREGFMTMFIFLPACFGNSFANYLNQIIPSILSGLADDIEAIRDIALRAGRLLVKNFATKAIDLLLPELQRGLADDSYRIRLSSVELVGDLLFNLTGITSKVEDGEEEESAAQAGASLLEVLGEDRRNKVLSSLYICRCDTSGMVRAAAIAVWKALVATPRTLREIVPTLIQMIISRLASSNMEQKVIASNALGEVIRKAGDGVFASLLPSLEDGLQTSTDVDNRQGICIALREIVNAASPEALEEHEKKLIAIVRVALTDSNVDVREAAAESFDSLQQTFGKRAVDQVLPHLLNLLRSEAEAEHALSALLTLLTETTRANVILPNLIPTLLTTPISAFNARALASLAKVGGASMVRRLPIILNTLADNVVSCKDGELRAELETAFDAVLQSVDEYDGLNTAMSVMLAMIKHDDHRRRAIAAIHLANFFSKPVADYSRYHQDLIRVLLISFDDRDKAVVSAAWSALSQLQSHMRKEEMESLVPSTRQVLQHVGTAGSNLPGFALPKGILPVLQIFLQGLMNGTTDQRVQAAMGISDIIDRCSADSLKPMVTQITGPLIRVVGERSMDVKCAILYTLNQLLEKIPTFLRPFLPQLQRTFTKSIADPTSDLLRSRAIKALSTLITLTPRVDPLIAELVTGAKTPDDGVRNAMLKALQEVVSKVGANMSDASQESILSLMDTQADAQDDGMTITNARLLGAMIKVLPSPKAANLIKSRVLVQPSTNASILALNAVLLESASAILPEYIDNVKVVLEHALSHRSAFIQQNAILATGKFLLSPQSTDSDSSALFSALSHTTAPGPDIDSRRLSLVVLRTVSRHHPSTLQPHLAALIPPVFASVRDPVIPVKLAAEAAFLQLFNVVDEESAVFDEYMKDAGKALPMGVQRPMSEYFKRVAIKLGAQARERREAEGGQGGLGLSSDEVEDEKEVWSVGRVEIEGGVGQDGE